MFHGAGKLDSVDVISNKDFCNMFSLSLKLKNKKILSLNYFFNIFCIYHLRGDLNSM